MSSDNPANEVASFTSDFTQSKLYYHSKNDSQ